MTRQKLPEAAASSKPQDGYEEAEIWSDGKLLSDRPAEPSAGKPLVRTLMFKAEWIRLAIEAFKLHQLYPKATALAVTKELNLMLVANEHEQPAESKLRALVEAVFAIDDNPLMQLPSNRSTLRRARKGN